MNSDHSNNIFMLVNSHCSHTCAKITKHVETITILRQNIDKMKMKQIKYKIKHGHTKNINSMNNNNDDDDNALLQFKI